MLSAALIWFILVLVLGIVGNVLGLKQGAASTYAFWFWNVVWVIALQMVWIS